MKTLFSAALMSLIAAGAALAQDRIDMPGDLPDLELDTKVWQIVLARHEMGISWGPRLVTLRACTQAMDGRWHTERMFAVSCFNTETGQVIVSK